MTHAVVARLAESIVQAAGRKESDDQIVHAVERLVLDSFACGLGAVNSEPMEALHKWARIINGSPPAHLFGTRETSSVMGAAVANCTMIRHLDLNDCVWGAKEGGHPSDNIGACVAVAEVAGASTAALIKSIQVAYEVQMRTMEFARVSFFRTTGWDVTTFVPLATAAATGVLLGLDAGRMGHALAIAASNPTIGEIRVGQISLMKATSAGLAAARGVEAAYLAGYGITGPVEVFEGKRGLAQVALGECDWDILTARVDEWRLPRTCLKQYPAAYIIHSAIEAALALRHECGLVPERIGEVTVAGFGWLIEDMVNGMGGKSRYDVDVRETADHSLPYCVAVSLVDGEYTLAQLDEPRWESPEVKAMLAKVKCVHEPALDAGFPARRPARVTVTTTDGATFSREVEFPKGDPRAPLSDDEIAAKFRSLSQRVLSESRQQRAIEVALELRNHSISELWDVCLPDA
jgi:2-methylcitrate dehydratase